MYLISPLLLKSLYQATRVKGHVYACVRRFILSLAIVSTIFRLYFAVVLTLWYLMLFYGLLFQKIINFTQTLILCVHLNTFIIKD